MQPQIDSLTKEIIQAIETCKKEKLESLKTKNFTINFPNYCFHVIVRDAQSFKFKRKSLINNLTKEIESNFPNMFDTEFPGISTLNLHTGIYDWLFDFQTKN